MQQGPLHLHGNKWVVFGVTAVGVFMATLDSSIVNIALPAIAASFGLPLNGEVAWVTVAYLVVMASALLTLGRLADMIGRKPVWMSGLVLFTLSSACCGLVPSLGLLVAVRAVQGLSGACLLSISPAMLTSGFPAHERGRALGLSAVNVALAVSLGPTLGGLILAASSWRWIFYVNVPLGLLGLCVSWTLLHEPRWRKGSHFDFAGAILLSCGLAALTLCLSFGKDLGWFSLPVVLGYSSVVLSLIALVVVERRAISPMIDFILLRRRVFTSSLFCLMLAMMALFAVSFMLPFYLEQLRAFPSQLAGLLLVPLSLIISCVAPFSGALADRLGTRWIIVAGLTLCCAGLLLLSQLNATSSLSDITGRLALIGIGQGLFQAPNSSALLGDAPLAQQGVASGFLATSRVMGQAIGAALAGALFSGLGGAQAGLLLVLAHAHGAVDSSPPQLQATFLLSFRVTFFVCALLAGCGASIVLLRGSQN